MLRIIQSAKQLAMGQLARVYAQSNRIHGMKAYADKSENLQILYAEQDFYTFLDDFFKEKGAVYAVWTVAESYKAALRLMPYLNGYLVAGLETVPEERGKGYAKMLIKATLLWLKEQGCCSVYSHIADDNIVSIAAHKACGFKILTHGAVYLDGSYHPESSTYCCRL